MKKIKLIIFILLVAVILILDHRFGWSGYLGNLDNLGFLKEMVQQNLWQAMLIYLVVTVVGCVVLALPGATFALFAGIQMCIRDRLHTVEGGEFFDLMLDTGTLFDGEQTTKLLFIVKVLDKGSRKILQFFKALFPADFVNLGPETFLQQLQCAVQRCAAAGFLYKSAHLFTRFQQLSIVVPVSYTHLDVYKRQGVWCQGNWCNGTFCQ